MKPLPHLPIPEWTPDLEASFLDQGQLVESESGCLVWTGAIMTVGGYGRFYVPSGIKGQVGRNYRAHRVIWAWKRGEPGEAVVDHLCHDPLTCFTMTGNYCEHRRCVNIEHLALSTRGDNVRRGVPGSPLWHPLGNSLKVESKSGNELDYVDPRGWRGSREDRNEAMRRFRERNRDRINAKRRAEREHVTYPEQACQFCGRLYSPERSTARFCNRADCLNERQRLGRLRRQGRENEYKNPFKGEES